MQKMVTHRHLMASYIYSLRCIAGQTWQLTTNQSKLYPPTISILAHLLCKVANPAMFFLSKCFRAQQSTKVVYRQCFVLYDSKTFSLNVAFTQRPPVTKSRNLLMSFRSNTWIDFTQDSCICKNCTHSTIQQSPWASTKCYF